MIFHENHVKMQARGPFAIDMILSLEKCMENIAKRLHRPLDPLNDPREEVRETLLDREMDRLDD